MWMKSSMVRSSPSLSSSELMLDPKPELELDPALPEGCPHHSQPLKLQPQSHCQRFLWLLEPWLFAEWRPLGLTLGEQAPFPWRPSQVQPLPPVITLFLGGWSATTGVGTMQVGPTDCLLDPHTVYWTSPPQAWQQLHPSPSPSRWSPQTALWTSLPQVWQPPWISPCYTQALPWGTRPYHLNLVIIRKRQIIKFITLFILLPGNVQGFFPIYPFKVNFWFKINFLGSALVTNFFWRRNSNICYTATFGLLCNMKCL